MSWLEHSKDSSRLLKGAAVAVITSVLGLGVTGCAFHPMYATTSTGGNLTDAMKAVDIAPIPSRVGQRLRNELIFGTTGGGEASAPVYRLDIALRESVRNTLVTNTGAPTGQILQLDAEFRVVRIKDNEALFKGYSTSEAAYDLTGFSGTTGSIYGDTRAVLDAENRAARSLADTLKTRVAAFLSRDA
ncbi:MAG TPA: LPS assembly lipoprotein LptE [Geobacterales bacterium]|nr:LPS assembly lipoprotein LptE [Geobacterales bacterium]